MTVEDVVVLAQANQCRRNDREGLRRSRALAWKI